MPQDVTDVLEFGRAALKVLTHPKFQSVSPAAGWMWMRGLMYLTAGNGTFGGLITETAFKQMGFSLARAQELQEAGLWRRAPNGWRFIRLSAVAPAPSPLKKPGAAVTLGIEVLRYETIGDPNVWILTKEQADDWQKTFSTVRVDQECLQARAWLDANPVRRKTFKGMPRFLVSWLSTATNRRGPAGWEKKIGAGRTGAAPEGKYDHVTVKDND